MNKYKAIISAIRILFDIFLLPAHLLSLLISIFSAYAFANKYREHGIKVSVREMIDLFIALGFKKNAYNFVYDHWIFSVVTSLIFWQIIHHFIF